MWKILFIEEQNVVVNKVKKWRETFETALELEEDDDNWVDLKALQEAMDNTELKFGQKEYEYVVWWMFRGAKDVNKLKWNFDNLSKPQAIHAIPPQVSDKPKIDLKDDSDEKDDVIEDDEDVKEVGKTPEKKLQQSDKDVDDDIDDDINNDDDDKQTPKKSVSDGNKTPKKPVGDVQETPKKTIKDVKPTPEKPLSDKEEDSDKNVDEINDSYGDIEADDKKSQKSDKKQEIEKVDTKGTPNDTKNQPNKATKPPSAHESENEEYSDFKDGVEKKLDVSDDQDNAESPRGRDEKDVEKSVKIDESENNDQSLENEAKDNNKTDKDDNKEI